MFSRDSRWVRAAWLAGLLVMLGASAGFTLPYSYQTNLMVFAGELRCVSFSVRLSFRRSRCVRKADSRFLLCGRTASCEV